MKADTNDLFLPMDKIATGAQQNDEEFNARERENAIKAGESKPAELDPEGNWGPVIGGFQLSIRSATNVFIQGKPITVSTIIRNTTTNDLIALAGLILPEIIIIDEAGREGSALPLQGFSGPMSINLPSRRQRKTEVDVSFGFSTLKPGTYQLRALGRSYGPPGQKANYRQVPSGLLTVRLIDAPSGNGETNSTSNAPH